MAEEIDKNAQPEDLPFLGIPRPEEAGTHPTSTSNMPPMKDAPEELKEMAAKAADPDSAIARKATPPAQVRMAKPLPKQDDDPGTWEFGRRNFLRAAGWMSFFGFITVASIGALRMMFPRTLYEPPKVFKAGVPKEYNPNTVSEKYKDTERVWICRDEEKIFALVAICTHLGCTPRWLIKILKVTKIRVTEAKYAINRLLSVLLIAEMVCGICFSDRRFYLIYVRFCLSTVRFHLSTVGIYLSTGIFCLFTDIFRRKTLLFTFR